MNSERSKDSKSTAGRRAGRPSALAMITAAAASASAFVVITKSGLAGTLVGAAVFSAVYHGASHWIGNLFERAVTWWLERRGVEVIDSDRVDEETPAAAATLTAAATLPAPVSELKAASRTDPLLVQKAARA